MNLAKQLSIYTLLLVVIIIGSAKFHLDSTNNLKHELATYAAVGKIIKGIFELNIISNDHIATRTKRSEIQWSKRHASLTNLLLGIEQRVSVENLVLIKRIRLQLSKERALFFKILAEENVGGEVLSPQSIVFISKISSQIRLISQQMFIDVNKVGSISQVELNRTENNLRLLIQATLILIAVVFTLLIFWVRMFFLAPILKLKEHSLVLIAGKYREKIIFPGKNEITDLAGSINILSETVADKVDELVQSANSLEQSLTETKSAEFRYSTILSSATDCIITIDAVGIIQTVNLAVEALFGYSANELVGENISILVSSPDKEKHDSYIKNYQKTSIAKIIGIGRQVVGQKKDGSLVPVWLTISEMVIDGTIYYSGILRDVSEEIASKEAMANVNEQLEIINKELNENNWLKTQAAIISGIMQGAANLELMSNDVVASLSASLGAGHGVLYIKNDIVEKTDELKSESTLSLLGSYAFKQRKNVSGEILIGEGLVGQCAKEKKAIYLTDVPSDYIKINSALGENKPLFLLLVPILFEQELKGVVELASFKEFSDNERELIDVVAVTIGVAINGIQRQQKTTELLERTQRQSEELQAQQEELQASNEALSEKSTSLEIQKKTIEQSREELEIKSKDLALASKYKSEFISNMSHELRTPLNSFLLLSKGLSNNKKGNLDKDQLEDLAVIHEGGLDLLNLINDIMDLSKIEAGKISLQIEEVNLAATCSNITSLFNPRAENKSLEFTVVREDKTPGILKTDVQRLEQILKNFLSNAFKFTARGSIQLKIHFPDPSTCFLYSSLNVNSTLAFSVIDTGVGVAPGKQKDIFEAFQQADGSTSRKYGGTGLGLTISRELARLLGGEIQLISTPGEGSTFTLYLPLSVDVLSARIEGHTALSSGLDDMQPALEASVEIEAVEHESVEQFISDDRNQLGNDEDTMLIIEDDAKFAKILLDIVRNRGYKGLVAGNGKTGLYLALEYQPKGIILDFGLPDMNGNVVLEQLKFHLKTKHIPVHVISGEEQAHESMQHGAIGFLSKPANEEDINHVISDMQRIIAANIKTALIVEDNEGSQHTITKLISNKGIRVECVSTGLAAVESITAGNFDCVILDLDLPDMSGFDVLEKLSEDKSICMPPIIIYTGQELSAKQRNKLQKYSATIVLKNAESPDKLLDEALLFMHSLTEHLSLSQKETIYNIHDDAKLLQDRKILLVDDDMRNTFALSRRLQEDGLIVVEADNGETALNKLNEFDDIDLVIMDIMMPIMDGYEAMRRIRKSNKYKKIPIIALTAKAMLEDRKKCIEAGATDYLSKPVDYDKLLSMLKVWLFRK